MPEILSEQEFKLRSDEALTSLYNALANASDGHDFEPDYGGALTVEFAAPAAKFVISPNSPVRQIWISAHSKSFKLDWDAGKSAFVFADTGQTLKELVQSAVSKQLGEDVKL